MHAKLKCKEMSGAELRRKSRAESRRSDGWSACFLVFWAKSIVGVLFAHTVAEKILGEIDGRGAFRP